MIMSRLSELIHIFIFQMVLFPKVEDDSLGMLRGTMFFQTVLVIESFLQIEISRGSPGFKTQGLQDGPLPFWFLRGPFLAPSWEGGWGVGRLCPAVSTSRYST